jgi:hypothetical protein
MNAKDLGWGLHASSIEASIDDRRDVITVVTYVIENVMCATSSVENPRRLGQPIHFAVSRNSISVDTPVSTSGMTSGVEISPDSKVRPRNRPNRTSAMPAIVPRMVAALALISASRRLSHAASRIWVFSNSLAYHTVENPPHTVTSRDLLNENTIRLMIGA